MGAPEAAQVADMLGSMGGDLVWPLLDRIVEGDGKGAIAEAERIAARSVSLDMALEADLGIDSIKRVEILSAIRERAPGQREVQLTEFAALRTLGQIVEHMRQGSGAGATAASEPALEVVAAQIPAADAVGVFVGFAEEIGRGDAAHQEGGHVQPLPAGQVVPEQYCDLGVEVRHVIERAPARHPWSCTF